MLTVKHWRSLQHAPRWARNLKQMAWAASILLKPTNLGLFVTSRYTAEPLTADLQHELLMLLYTRFVRQVGYYLIEMNSGRLRGGADLYLQTFGRQTKQANDQLATGSQRQSANEEQTSSSVSMTRTASAPPVTISLIGQVSSGKSSLINAIVGTTAAAVDILPCTRNVARHLVSSQSPGAQLTQETGAQLLLLDTPGYGEAGATDEQLEQIEMALKESDAVLLVLDGHSPARRADQQTIEKLQAWYRANPQLKPAPIIGVVTHVDLLPPALMWEPPYEWEHPNDKKSQVIHDAVKYVEEIWSSDIIQAVPICTAPAPDRRWGLEENLLPALSSVLDEAKCVSLLRAFETRLSEKQFDILLRQLRAIGRSIRF
ncbi:MAG: GTPase domain-containing protein, partial [Planctomycetales bacterium]|nr:GTPase domain-containing protein [Planctomycetales bacterium]